MRASIRHRCALAVALCASALALAAAPADAAVIHVTNMGDSGPGTLRDAIATAPPGSTIIVPAGTIKLTTTQLSIDKQLEIDGAGASATTIHGNDAHRVFAIEALNVKITKLAIVHGRLAQAGGSLSAAGISIDSGKSLTLDTVRVTDNVIDVGGDATHSGGVVDGGAIFNGGTLAVKNSVLAHNSALADGKVGSHSGGIINGGVIRNQGNISVSRTSISNNLASALGHGGNPGGIVNGGVIDNEVGPLPLFESALDNNTARVDAGTSSPGGIVDGGAVENNGLKLTLTRTSVSGNTASALGEGTGPGGIVDGGAIENNAGDLSITGGRLDRNVARADGGVTNGGGGVVNGGAIDHAGDTLSLDQTSASGNASSAAAQGSGGGGVVDGGAVYDAGSASKVTTITDSRIGGNSANVDGANAGVADGIGVYLLGHQVTLDADTLDGNKATARGGAGGGGGSVQGGGVYDTVPLVMTNVTISGNALDASGTAAGGAANGAGIYTNDQVTSVNSTLADNSVKAGGTSPGSARGGNVAIGASPVDFKNTIVSGGHGDAGFENCRETVTSDGHNIDSLDQCGFHGTGDQFGKNPLLGPLADNGGPVPTRAITKSSPAFNKGDNVGCPSTDARGFHRPAFLICDVGAFELNPDNSPPSITIVTPADGAHYTQGKKVLASYFCTDHEGAADIVLCQGPAPPGKPIDTSTAGKHAFTVQAADKSGNTSKKTVHYTVDTTVSSPPKVTGLPPDQGCVPGKLKLKISVHPTRLKRAAVFLDGKLIASSKKHDFKVTISGSQLSPGRHQIKILREYKSGTKRRSTVSFTRCKKGGRSPHIHTEGTPDQGSCTAKPFKMFVSITRVDVKTIRVTLDGKSFAKPGKKQFTLSIPVPRLKVGHHRLIIRASDKFKNGSVSITDFIRCA